MKDIFIQEHIYGGQITQDGINSGNFDFEISTDSDCIHSGIYGLRLTGSGNDKDKSYWSVVFSENPFVVKKRLLSFWVKGKFGGEIFTIDIDGNQDPMIENSEQYVNVSASEWHLVNIPLNSMFIFGIKFYFTGSENRSICIDDISFPQ